MCTGLELIGALAGPALGVAGTAIQQNEQQQIANQQAKARNEALQMTLAKNRKLADQSRDRFDKRLRQADDKSFDNQQKRATNDRTKQLQASVEATPEMEKLASDSITGTAPSIVNSDLASGMKSVLDDGKEQAKQLAELGAYGDTWLRQGFADTAAGRDIGVTTNKAAGNSAIMPYSQDFAEWRATRPISPFGQILSGLGGAVGSLAGSQSNPVLPRQTYTSPFIQ